MAKKRATKATSKKKARPRPGRNKKDPKTGLTLIQSQFLEAFAQIGQVEPTCRTLGIDKTQHYRRWLKVPKYKEAFEAALKDYEAYDADRVLAEVQSRAYDGWTEEIIEEKVAPTINADTGETEPRTLEIKRRRVHKWSITALLWNANRHYGNPSTFKLVGKDGGPIEHQVSVTAFRELVKAVNGDK